MPNVRVATIDFRGACVDVILVVHDEDAVPYYLVEDYSCGGSTARAGAIYTRDADSNTPKNGTAAPLATERLWRRRFGLDKSPLERLSQLLKDPSKWEQTLPVFARDEECSGRCYYHVDYPEFTFVRRPVEDCESVECFMLASLYFSHPNWWTCYFYYHQTMICKLLGAYSDHLWIPAPTISALRDHGLPGPPEDTHFYTYYPEGSIERVAMMFELDGSKEGPSALEEVRWLDSLVPTFRDENEWISFERWVELNWDAFLERCEHQTTIRHVPEGLSGPAKCYGRVERHAKESATLVEMLKEYRDLHAGER